MELKHLQQLLEFWHDATWMMSRILSPREQSRIEVAVMMQEQIKEAETHSQCLSPTCQWQTFPNKLERQKHTNSVSHPPINDKYLSL